MYITERLEILSKGGVERIRGEWREEEKRESCDCVWQPDPVKCSIVLNLSTVTKDSEQERNRLTEGDIAREHVVIVSVPQVWVHIKPHTHLPHLLSLSSMDCYKRQAVPFICYVWSFMLDHCTDLQYIHGNTFKNKYHPELSIYRVDMMTLIIRTCRLWRPLVLIAYNHCILSNTVFNNSGKNLSFQIFIYPFKALLNHAHIAMFACACSCALQQKNESDKSACTFATCHVQYCISTDRVHTECVN